MIRLQLADALSAREGASFQQVLGAVTVVMAIAVGCWFGWNALATPAGGSARLADLGREAEAMEQAPGPRLRASAYPAGAVCPSLADGEAQLRQRLQAAAGGLALEQLTLATGAPNAQSGLTPIAASFEVTGPYDAVLALLNGLAASEPTVFVNQADLTPKVSVVTLNFTGRILCWTNARP